MELIETEKEYVKDLALIVEVGGGEIISFVSRLEILFIRDI